MRKDQLLSHAKTAAARRCTWFVVPFNEGRVRFVRNRSTSRAIGTWWRVHRGVGGTVGYSADPA